MRRLLRRGHHLRWLLRNSSRAGGDQALEFDSRHAVALHLQNRETIAGEIEAFAAVGNESQSRQDKAAERGVGGIFGKMDLVLRLEIAQADGSVEDHGHVRAGADDLRRLHHVELVVNFAHHLFEHVLERDQAEDAAKFVHDHGQADAARAHLQKQFAGELVFRHDQQLAQQAAEVEVRPELGEAAGSGASFRDAARALKRRRSYP